MLLHRFEHVAEAAEHIWPDRLALERAGPHPRDAALVGGDAKVVGPEHHEALDQPAIGDHGALQPRQRLGAVGFLDDIGRLRRRLRRLHRFRRSHRRVGIRGLHGGGFTGDVRSNFHHRCAGFSGGVARLHDLELIGEHGLCQCRRGLQPGHLEQPAIGTAQFRLDEAARVGSRIDEIARRAAARTEAKAIERDKGCLRIAGHRIFSLGFLVRLNWAYDAFR